MGGGCGESPAQTSALWAARSASSRAMALAISPHLLRQLPTLLQLLAYVYQLTNPRLQVAALDLNAERTEVPLVVVVQELNNRAYHRSCDGIGGVAGAAGATGARGTCGCDWTNTARPHPPLNRPQAQHRLNIRLQLNPPLHNDTPISAGPHFLRRELRQVDLMAVSALVLVTLTQLTHQVHQLVIQRVKLLVPSVHRPALHGSSNLDVVDGVFRAVPGRGFFATRGDGHGDGGRPGGGVLEGRNGRACGRVVVRVVERVVNLARRVGEGG